MAVDINAGALEYIRIADDAVFDGATGAADRAQSWSIWVNPDRVNVAQVFLAKWVTVNEYYFQINATNELNVVLYDPGSADRLYLQATPAIFTVGVWTNVLMTYDGSETVGGLEVYIDGVAQGGAVKEAAYGGMQSDGPGYVEVGRLAGGQPYDGQLEDVRHWSRVLTVEEVAALAAGYRRPIGGEDCWLDLSLARGAYTGSLAQGTNLFNDLSGNGNDGDPYNTPTLVASECPRMGVMI